VRRFNASPRPRNSLPFRPQNIRGDRIRSIQNTQTEDISISIFFDSMPFYGQPSWGCKECLKRRVKCDRATPACQRCRRACRTCSGYQARIDLIFRDMNHVAEVKVTKRTKAAANQRKLVERPGQLANSPKHISPAQVAESKLRDDIRSVYRPEAYVAPSEAPGWEEVSVTQFFADYIVLSDKLQDSLQFLPGLCRRLNDCHLLKESLHAVAFRSRGNQSGAEWLAREGSLAYSRALLLLAQVSEDDAMSDSALATVYLLGLYEVSTLVPFHIIDQNRMKFIVPNSVSVARNSPVISFPYIITTADPCCSVFAGTSSLTIQYNEAFSVPTITL
jgi:hypothetical protein